MKRSWLASRYFWRAPFYYLTLALNAPSKYHHPPGFIFCLLVLLFQALPKLGWTLEQASWYARNRKRAPD